MRTLLLYFFLNILLVAIPQICTGQTVQQIADEMRQRLISKYLALAIDNGMEPYSEIGAFQNTLYAMQCIQHRII